MSFHNGNLSFHNGIWIELHHLYLRIQPISQRLPWLFGNSVSIWTFIVYVGEVFNSLYSQNSCVIFAHQLQCIASLKADEILHISSIRVAGLLHDWFAFSCVHRITLRSLPCFAFVSAYLSGLSAGLSWPWFLSLFSGQYSADFDLVYTFSVCTF